MTTTPFKRLLSDHLIAARWMKFVIVWVVLYLFGATPPVFSQAAGCARTMVAPDRGVAGHFGTWTVSCILGAEGMERGGFIRVQLPDAWHAGERNSAWRLQATNPAHDHFISAHASRTNAALETEVEDESSDWLVKGFRQGLDGRSERYVFVVRVQLISGRLFEGDTLHVVYGDQSGGSRGMRAGVIHTAKERVLMELSRNGVVSAIPIPNTPELHIQSGVGQKIWLHGRSDVVVKDTSYLHLAVLDEHFNPVSEFEGELELTLITGNARFDIPGTVSMPEGWLAIPFLPQESGILRVGVSLRGGLFRAVSNPVRVHESEPDREILWGDLHSHSHHSHDGVGKDPFQYARDIAKLDFYAVTDHSFSPQDGFTRGLGEHVWDAYTAMTDAYHAPGEFVTLHGYEASFRAPYGHHNIYFKGQPGPLIQFDQITLEEAWTLLEAGEVLTIPHHTGKFPRPISWDIHDSALRRNIEIYSGHGLSEAHDPSHPLAFEQSDFTSPSTSSPPGSFAQDAWIKGLQMSTIASSDDHRSQPGKPHFGLVAVEALARERSQVFESLYQRKSYATTGVRMLMDFSIDGHPMGSNIEVHDAPTISFTLHGTDEIEEVELLRYTASDGHFEVRHHLEPAALDFSWSRVDENLGEDAIYYLRVRQKNTIEGRPAMAWSSPIWVSYTSDK